MVRTDALVWKGDPQLKRYFKYQNPRILTRYGGGVARTETYVDGVSQGKRVEIRKPVEGGKRERESGGGRLLEGR